MRGRPLLVFLATSLLLLWGSVMSADSSKVGEAVGVWVTADGDGWIEISRHGELLHGRILGGPKDDDRRDSENPDPDLRDRRLTGLRIIEGLRPAGPGEWTGGSIYDPNNGKTYRCSLELEDANTLKVRGYIGVSLFGRTERWTRKAVGD